MDNMNEGLTVQLNQNERMAILNHLNLATNSLSPLFGLTKDVSQVSALSAERTSQISQPSVQRALEIAAAPDLVIEGRIGGGSVDLMELKIARRKDRGNELALVVAAEDASLQIRLFAGVADFVNWFVSNYAGKNEQTVANYIPPTVELGEFLYLLHAIDAFRIASFKGMLDYKAGQRPTLTLGEFTDTMRRAVRSRDIRWLLPAFLILTPGLDPATLDLDAEKTRILMNRQFLVTHQDPSSQQQVLGFAEAGQIMGVEFYRTWLLAAGFAIKVAAPGGVQTVNRLFIAPTALANHWVQIQESAGQPARVNHQALTSEQLAYKMGQVLDQALTLPVSPLVSESAAPIAQPPQTATPAQTAVTAPTASPTPVAPASAPSVASVKFCPHCGNPIKPNAKFCATCGNKL